MAVVLWTVVPLVALHVVLWWKYRAALRFQLLVNLLLVAVVGPALVTGGDLNPVRVLEQTPPYATWEWSDDTGLQPTQSDLVLQFHPWWAQARHQILDGRLPLIGEHVGAGMPLLAHGQIGLWAPVMLPVWVLGPERGTTVMAFWKIELAAMGAFLMLWSGWRLRWAAAGLGGVAWGGSAFLLAWLLVPLSWVAAALPWLWWWVLAALRVRARAGTILGLGLACGGLLGCGLHPEMAVVTVGSAVLAGLVFHPRRWRRLVAIVLVSVPVTVGLAWPTLAAISSSAKARELRELEPNRSSLPGGVRRSAVRQALVPLANGLPGRSEWRQSFPYAAAAAGVGAAALVMAAGGRIRRRHRALAWSALAVLGVAAVLAYRLPPLDGLLVRVPPLDRMTLPRFVVLVPWGLSLLAALGADGLAVGRPRPWPWRSVAAGAVVAAAVLSRPWQLAGPDGALVGLTVAAALVTAVVAVRPAVVTWIAALELALCGVGVNPLARPADRLPRPAMIETLVEETSRHPGRILGLDGVMPPNTASRYGLSDLRAYDPVRPYPFARMMAALGEPESVLGGPIREAPPGLLGAWSVRYLVAPPGRTPRGWTVRWQDSTGALWSNPRWLPEVRVVGRTVAAEGDPGWELLVSDGVDFASEAVVPPGSPRVAAERPSIRGLFTESTLVRADLECDGPCLLVVARPWAPGWTAAVDGVRTPVVRANLAGLGVVSPVGAHTVELRYRPWSW